MKKITTITRKGQVTIPQTVREKLQIGYGDKVEFTFSEQRQVILQPVKTDLESLYGILAKDRPAENIEEQRKAAREWIGKQGGRS
ncbi:MAG: type II toxin-antitoxin system PrlF family antitoxin [Bacillota bacterium]